MYFSEILHQILFPSCGVVLWWLFINSAAKFKEAVEWLFDEHLKYQIIKVYPWTTKKEVKKQFDNIRETQPQMRLRADLYPTNLKIMALRDAGWKYSEITNYLSLQLGNDQQVASKMKKREKELKALGKTVAEICPGFLCQKSFVWIMIFHEDFHKVIIMDSSEPINIQFSLGFSFSR